MIAMNSHSETAPHTPPTVRPFQNADAEAVARLVTAGVRDHWLYHPEQFRESSDPHKIRLVAERGGNLIATANLSPFGDGAPDALRLDLAGDGAAFSPLYLHLLAELPPGFPRLLGVTREDFSEKMAFYTAAGFRNAWQSWGAHLDLTTFDFERWRPLEEKLYVQGFEVARWKNDATDAEWDALYELHRQGEKDVPRNPVTTSASLGREALREVMTREEAVFVVWHKQQPVALTRLTLPQLNSPGQHSLQEAAEVANDLTTTHPAWRSRGLATLLKAHALGWARAQGYAEASTGGTVLNLPMLRVNTRLGYVTEQMWVTWEYRLH